jgi:phosphatidylglycerophosphate synthase
MKRSTTIWIDVSNLQSAIGIFGLAPLERMRRTVMQIAPRALVAVSGSGVHSDAWPSAEWDASTLPLGQRLRIALQTSLRVVALDAATIVDPRLLRYFLNGASVSIAERTDGESRAVVLCMEAAMLDAIPADAATIVEVADALRAAGRIQVLNDDEFPAYVDKLRRSLPFWIYQVRDHAARQSLERRMFWDNYKGSTDLLTAHVYPPLVWPCVRFCAAMGVHPNAVTVLSIVLALVAIPLFANGLWIAGFFCAYAMSVLDSVDGKLARLTLTDSAVGNVLDHGLDIVHPPFWYFAWAQGLILGGAGSWLNVAAWILIGFYIADRIVLRIARHKLRHSLHSATPLDAKALGVIARRNITMSIMALALLLGQGVLGFMLVVTWHGLTFAWHSWRTLLVGWLRPVKRVENNN